MKIYKCKKGASIIEVIVAVGIFAFISTGIVGLYLSGYSSSLRDKEKFIADMYLMEGFEAVKSIKDYGYAGLTDGTHGLSDSSGYWQFSGSSDTYGELTRSVEVESVQRGTDCAIVSSGGEVDDSSKKVTVTVSWNLEASQDLEYSDTAYFHNWRSPESCGEVENTSLAIDVSGVGLTGGSKKVEGIVLTNSSESDLVIDKITVTWSGSALIQKVKIENENFWRKNGTASPSGEQSSGTELDGVDYTILPSESVEVKELEFDEKMQGVNFTVRFTMSDGSYKGVSFST